MDESDTESILTTLSFKSCSEFSEFCLDYFDDEERELADSFFFQLKDEVIFSEEKINHEKEKLEYYLTECKRYELAPVSAVKRVLLGGIDDLDLKVFLLLIFSWNF